MKESLLHFTITAFYTTFQTQFIRQLRYYPRKPCLRHKKALGPPNSHWATYKKKILDTSLILLIHVHVLIFLINLFA